MKKINDIEFINICEQSDTMAEAAKKLNLAFTTFKRYAEKLNVYKPNQSGKGINKKANGYEIPLDDILEGKYPHYCTSSLSRRLKRYGYKENKCEECGITEWNGKKIKCQLHHINGVSTDHRIENLKMLCPNCHSQTPTFAGRNNKRIN